MVPRPSHYDRDRSRAFSARRHTRLSFHPDWNERSVFWALERSAHLLDKRAPEPSESTDEFSALNLLIHDRGARWSKQARAIKFDIEFNAIEKERRRVAKELHDEILPVLARLIRKVDAADPDAAEVRGDATHRSLVETLHATVAAFRDLLGELHPVDLEELGLVPALSNLCRRHERRGQKCVLYSEKTEDCNLSTLQQLCVYRAVQVVLEMFRDSENDILVIHYDRLGHGSEISIRCIDKSVSEAEWLSSGREGFDAFESWCATAGAEVSFATPGSRGVSCDAVIRVSEEQSAPQDFHTLVGQITQLRLNELDSIFAAAQEEWAQLINRDCAIFKELVVVTERKRIMQYIDVAIRPHLDRVLILAEDFEAVRREVRERIKSVDKGIAGVMSELHQRLLDEQGLISSMKTLVERFRRASLIHAKLISNIAGSEKELDDIPLDARFAIFRVTQEALNNIEKHSGATRALVTVDRNINELIVRIEDNGTGFNEAGNAVSRGLKNIQERASAVGARVVWAQSESFECGVMVTFYFPNE